MVEGMSANFVPSPSSGVCLVRFMSILPIPFFRGYLPQRRQTYFRGSGQSDVATTTTPAASTTPVTTTTGARFSTRTTQPSEAATPTADLPTTGSNSSSTVVVALLLLIGVAETAVRKKK